MRACVHVPAKYSPVMSSRVSFSIRGKILSCPLPSTWQENMVLYPYCLNTHIIAVANNCREIYLNRFWYSNLKYFFHDLSPYHKWLQVLATNCSRDAVSKNSQNIHILTTSFLSVEIAPEMSSVPRILLSLVLESQKTYEMRDK